jgi:hypothetical protein
MHLGVWHVADPVRLGHPDSCHRGTVLLAVILLMDTSTAKLLKFNHAVKVAAVFCASKNPSLSVRPGPR